MSFLPSSSAVSDYMALLKAEKAATKTAFHSSVAVASIKWEAELLLALQEFREAGGFVGIQEQLLSSIVRERLTVPKDEPKDKAKDKAKPVVLDVPCHWSFLDDRIDVKTLLLMVSDSTVVVRSGEPTMATERATLRIRILAAVKKGIREAVMAKLDEDLKEQNVRNLEFANVQYRMAREERMALDRVLVR